LPALSYLSCFFPAYNEAENLPALLDEVVATIPPLAQRWEAIVVDDGSSDATAEIVRAFGARHPEVRLAQHAHNLGYGAALRTGFTESRGDAVFFCDADRQFRLAEIDRLVTAFDDADMAIGYRIKRRDPWHRLVVARVYHLALRAMFGLHVRDVDCAFKLIDRRMLDDFASELSSRSAFISPELIIRATRRGFRLTEVGVDHYPRTAGKPKGASLKVILRTISEMRRLRVALGR
jgi:glycosyltransferase involved in cell wall biosynthesis